jgi:hypothetical protein
MSEFSSCSATSLAAGEPLAGTAVHEANWLLVEMRGAWGRDAVVDTELPAPARSAMEAFQGKVILVRRPDRRRGVAVIRATVTEAGGAAVRHRLARLDELAGADLEHGEPVSGPIVLVCAHGRRDACCARLGPPLFGVLAPHVAPERLWQSSHLGGHRFAPNVLVLPHGIHLGRIPVERGREVAELLEDGRIPLNLYRGRTVYAPPVQAAELLIRSELGCDRIADLRLVAHEGELVSFQTPLGELTARVEQRPGPVVPASCGALPEPTSFWAATLVGRSRTRADGTAGPTGS